jgi:hypothetical protein
VVTVTLPLVQVRGEGEVPAARIDDDTETVALLLDRGEAEPPYEIALRTVEGQELWRGRAAEGVPTARIPAAGLPAGDYVVVLESSTGPQRYYLRVQR